MFNLVVTDKTLHVQPAFLLPSAIRVVASSRSAGMETNRTPGVTFTSNRRVDDCPKTPVPAREYGCPLDRINEASAAQAGKSEIIFDPPMGCEIATTDKAGGSVGKDSSSHTNFLDLSRSNIERISALTSNSLMSSELERKMGIVENIVRSMDVIVGSVDDGSLLRQSAAVASFYRVTEMARQLVEDCCILENWKLHTSAYLIQFKEIMLEAGLSYNTIVQVFSSEDLRETVFPLVEVMNIMQQIAHGLSYLHGHNVVHRDLKSTNVLLPSLYTIPHLEYYVVKVADFGMSKSKESMSDMFWSPSVRTTSWRAPEIRVDRHDKSDVYSSRIVDVYDSGIKAFEILAGREPFQDVTKVHRSGRRSEYETGVGAETEASKVHGSKIGSKFGIVVEAEIVASKVHWSELLADCHKFFTDESLEVITAESSSCHETNSNRIGKFSKRATATVMDDDDLLSKLAPLVKQQIEDALSATLLPLVAVLRSREEKEQKHREQMLALEEQKLALKRQKLALERQNLLLELRRGVKHSRSSHLSGRRQGLKKPRY